MNTEKISGKAPSIWKLNNTLLNKFKSKKERKKKNPQGKSENTYQKVQKVEARSRWQNRRTWRSPPPPKHIKNMWNNSHKIPAECWQRSHTTKAAKKDH